MNTPDAITITAVHVGELRAAGEGMPIYVHVIDHPQARVLVDTGLTQLHPAVADLDPRIRPLNEQDFDIGSIDIVVNTHLHFDHCGGNHLFAGKPIYVQRQELEDARNENDYTIPEWSIPLGRTTFLSTESSSCCPGYDFSPRRATHAGRRSFWSGTASIRSSSPATQRSGLVNWTTLVPRGSCESALSNPSPFG